MNEVYELTPEQKLEAWGEGEWVNEPDYIEFYYEGYRCKIIRIYAVEGHVICLGHLCGYVCIPEEHACFGKHYNDIEIDCHGGLTCSEINKEGFHWIGFDCAHYNDIIPYMLEMRNKIKENFFKKFKNVNYPLFEDVYRNKEFVIEECKKIVKQLKEK